MEEGGTGGEGVRLFVKTTRRKPVRIFFRDMYVSVICELLVGSGRLHGYHKSGESVTKETRIRLVLSSLYSSKYFM